MIGLTPGIFSRKEIYQTLSKHAGVSFFHKDLFDLFLIFEAIAEAN